MPEHRKLESMSTNDSLGTLTKTELSKESLLSSASRIGFAMPVGISAFSSWMLGVGTMIGSMAWLIYGYMLSRAGASATLAAWFLAALINLPLCFILAELASMFPSAGGPYVYKYVALKRLFPAYGDFLGFCTGWLYWITMITGMACMANGFAGLMTSTIWPQNNLAPPWFASASILLLFALTTVLNFNHIRLVSRLNNAFTLFKLSMAAAFIYIVWTAKTSSLHYIFINGATADTGQLANFTTNIMKVLVLAITAFAGIELVGCTASETVNPQRNIPRAIMLTLGTVAAIYLLLSLAVFSSAKFSLSNGGAMLIEGTTISANCPALAGYLAGPLWGQIFTAGVIGSIVTCGFVSNLALARISYSMSQTKLFPANFSKLTDKDSIPREALIFQFFCLSAVAVGSNLIAKLWTNFDAYTFLGEVFGFLYSALAILYGISLISLRYTAPDWPRPFRLGGGNALAWVMCIGTTLVYGFVALACAQWVHQLTAMVLLLCGFPIYWLYKKPQTNEPHEKL